MTDDRAQRTAALDPAQSFIVEAPAGSGKTELLTQRFLGLLATVDLPEQIVAITFTRKAAAEMRQRIVATLLAAADDEPNVPSHRLATLALARRALARSDELGWALPTQSQRLRILTIDALNSNLAGHFPVLAGGVAGAEVTDDAQRLYRLAAQRTTDGLAESDALGEALGHWLQASGNALQQLEFWLAGMLPQRDRWQRLFAAAGGSGLTTTIEGSLGRLRDARCRRLGTLAGAVGERRIAAVLAEREQNLEGPPAPAAPTDLWPAVARLLLTRSGDWRRRFTRTEGFPPDATELRAELDAILEIFSATPGLREALNDLAQLPDSRLAESERQLLDALEPVLRRLLAELKLVFAERRTVDHTEFALTALQALGASNAPSDLLLALDRRIEHILVDEFQDTSNLQWDLLERLTAGWEAGDGRSLFLVGDPMQSIYRFRDADRSLFLRAREEGIGEIRLQAVQLSANFRSDPQLVHWVNSTFAAVFADADTGPELQTAFHHATPARAANAAAGVELHDLTGGSYHDEIERVVDIVRREVDVDVCRSIGILVRSRTHLLGLRSALAAAGLPAHAVEIDSLTDTQLGLDLIALTSALLHASDRVSWLAVLRSPTVGIGWRDLHALCAAETGRPIGSLLKDTACLDRLSPGARERAHWLRQRLDHGRSLRAERTLGRWIRECWYLIDGPAWLQDESELVLAERYFQDLDRLARAGDVDDPAELREWFSRPGGGELPAESGVEIMTIHRAKGLEFDAVILPGLGRKTRGSFDNFIINNKISLGNGQMVSLVGTPGPDPSGVHALLRRIESEEEAAERGRLLYVAATRARSRLHLLGSVNARSGTPQRGSLLETLIHGAEWPAPAPDPRADPGDAAAADADDAAATLRSELVELPLRRLQFDAALPIAEPAAGELGPASGVRPEFEWVNPASVQVGTLIHRELQRWADRATRDGALSPPIIAGERYRRELALLGVDPADLRGAASRVGDAIERVWADSAGRWILQPRPEAWSELRISVQTATGIDHLVLDRSFVTSSGERWIIDYKTGRHLGADVAGFLQSEVERYRPQLAGYARAVAATDPRPLRVGLYFPLMSKLVDWIPAPTEIT